MLALTALAAPAFPQPQSREEALSALQSAEAARRAEAVAWIAHHGGPADDELLHARLRDEDAVVRAYAEQGLWLLWSRSGDAGLDALMARGVDAMQAGLLAQAIALFSQAIERRPDFAEAWNKRATALYLAGDYARSLADCDEVLERNPRHFGALSGAGMIHFALENYAEAERWLRRALEVNPNLGGVEALLGQLPKERPLQRLRHR